MNPTKIGWAGFTWNPVTGCSPASEGCKNCYAARMATRQIATGCKRYDGTAQHGKWTGLVRCHEELLQEPLRRRKPAKIFVNSMSDPFHPDVPFSFLHKMFAVMALCQQHTFQVLTKRAEQMAKYLDATEAFGFGNHYGAWVDAAHEVLGVPDGQIDKTIAPRIKSAMDEGLRVAGMKCGTCLPNAWLGVTVENQEAIPRIAELLECPAVVRFLSVEPMLGPVLIPPFGIDWVICGPETGPGKRPMDPAWAIDLYHQCKRANVPFFWKGSGVAELASVHQMPQGAAESKL